jgi:hypothetical protein
MRSGFEESLGGSLLQEGRAVATREAKGAGGLLGEFGPPRRGGVDIRKEAEQHDGP